MNGDNDRLRGKQDSLLVCTDGPKPYIWKSLNALFFSNYLNLLMLCTPFAMMARAHGSDGVIFAFSLLAIAPCAERLSFVTEQLALHTNQTLACRSNAPSWRATARQPAWYGGSGWRPRSDVVVVPLRAQSVAEAWSRLSQYRGGLIQLNQHRGSGCRIRSTNPLICRGDSLLARRQGSEQPQRDA